MNAAFSIPMFCPCIENSQQLFFKENSALYFLQRRHSKNDPN